MVVRAPLISRVVLAVLAGVVVLGLMWLWRPATFLPGTRPLSYAGGDPYLRALMRTISASESNVLRPYHVLHGGESINSLGQHPNQCRSIRGGPNKGNCSTAAGRYQLLYVTWLYLAGQYHPLHRGSDTPDEVAALSFEPEYQDAVVMRWLADPDAWGMDIAAQLKKGNVKPVLRRLSRTWTSLGYGIENNLMSRELPRIYNQLLQQELRRAGLQPAGANPLKRKGQPVSSTG